MRAAPATSLQRTRARLAGAAVAASLLLGAGSPAGAEDIASGTRYRDPLFKFSFSHPGNWAAIPVAPGGSNENVVRKFAQDDAVQKGVLPETLLVFRSAPPEAPKDEDVGMPETPQADLVELIQKRIKAVDSHAVFVRPENVESRDGYPGRMWTTDTKLVDATGRAWLREFHVCVVWVKPDDPVQYGMWLRCGGEEKKRGEVRFNSVIQSFRWFDAKAKEVAVQSALSTLPLTEAKRTALERGLVKGWAILVSPKKQYVVVYNTKGKRNDLLAQLIAQNIERIREQLYETQFPPVKKIEDVSVVRICGDLAEYYQYGGPRGSAGYWSSKDEELVLYDAHPGVKLDEDTLAVAYHEAFHQYIYYAAGEINPHSWFNEGHGDYYAGARSAGATYSVRPFSWRIGRIKAAVKVGPCPKLPNGQFDRKKGGYTPLADFLKFSQDEYYDDSSVNYAQGWSLIYFLREIVPRNPSWKAKWSGILDIYFTTLRGTVPAPKPKLGKPPADSDPAMGDPAMGDPAMGQGWKDPGPVPEDEEEEAPAGTPGAAPPPPIAKKGEGVADDDDAGIAPAPHYDTHGDVDAALREAFKGVDIKELEAAWRASILQVPG